ncbi:HD domain-containing phosphohydrolase [Vibrio sp. HN007]|uniref:HD domain-containing phosphohydrolase n=1 Tax=Vibrio iocasae TaxID=3098914 RepID=UPI0035D4FD65
MDFLADTVDGKNELDSAIELPPWSVLVVDDDKEVHRITRLALSRFAFQERKLDLISAYSAEEAKGVLTARNDIALAIVDVVMETDQAGLELVKFIRDEIQDKLIRVVLRTGQAGKAPEEKVIQDHDIDDYRLKTDLTTEKLRTVLYSKLRSYSELCRMHEQRLSLNRAIDASSHVQKTRHRTDFFNVLSQQFYSLLGTQCSSIYGVVSPDFENKETEQSVFLFEDDLRECDGTNLYSEFPEHISSRCEEAILANQSKMYPDGAAFISRNGSGTSCLIYLSFSVEITGFDRHLIKVLGQNAVLTLQNISLASEISDTSKVLVYNLANAVEARSKETGAHVQRVSLVCEGLARYCGLNEREVMLIKYGSPLHDIGKVAISDQILHKPGKLDSEEWEEMKRHVEYGVEILSKSHNPVMKKAKEIAGSHHEKWDGSGYPKGLSGNLIPISGRITAVADVFDALGSKRSYKEAWGEEQIKAEMISLKDKHFDPDLVDILIEHWQEFISIREQYPD